MSTFDDVGETAENAEVLETQSIQLQSVLDAIGAEDMEGIVIVSSPPRLHVPDMDDIKASGKWDDFAWSVVENVEWLEPIVPDERVEALWMKLSQPLLDRGNDDVGEASCELRAIKLLLDAQEDYSAQSVAELASLISISPVIPWEISAVVRPKKDWSGEDTAELIDELKSMDLTSQGNALSMMNAVTNYIIDAFEPLLIEKDLYINMEDFIVEVAVRTVLEGYIDRLATVKAHWSQIILTHSIASEKVSKVPVDLQQ